MLVTLPLIPRRAGRREQDHGLATAFALRAQMRRILAAAGQPVPEAQPALEVNAGHPLPYLRRSSGELEQVDGRPQAPLAVRTGMRYQNRTVSLQPGDTLLVCTDGVVEAIGPGVTTVSTGARVFFGGTATHKALATLAPFTSPGWSPT